MRLQDDYTGQHSSTCSNPVYVGGGGGIDLLHNYHKPIDNCFLLLLKVNMLGSKQYVPVEWEKHRWKVVADRCQHILEWPCATVLETLIIKCIGRVSLRFIQQTNLSYVIYPPSLPPQPLILPSIATGEGLSLAACLTIVLIGPASLSCMPPLFCGKRNCEGCIKPSKLPPNGPVRALGVPGEGVCRGAMPPLPVNWSTLSDVGMAMAELVMLAVPVGVTAGTTDPGILRAGAAIWMPWMPCNGMSAGPLPDCRIYSGCWEVRSYTACRRGVGMATECVIGGGAGEDVGVNMPPFITASTGEFPAVNASTCTEITWLNIPSWHIRS